MTLWHGTLDFTIHAESEASARAAMVTFCGHAENTLLPGTATLHLDDENPIEAEQPAPKFCATCGNERGVPIPACCPH